MKESLLALVVMGAFAGAASAQSSVTIYGRVDQGLGKAVNSADKGVRDGGGSRLGFKGVEDLGGGMSAVFGFEHRFSPDTGVANATFWNGYSWVGLKGAFGTATLGRHYTSAFLLIQNQIDPFGGDTVAGLRELGIRPVGTTVRVADSIKWDYSASGFNVGVSVAEGIAGGKKPISVAANYSAGPLFVGAGYENPSPANDNLTTFGARYDLGVVNLSGGFSTGKNTSNQKVRAYLLGLTAPVGSGLVKAGWAHNKNSTTAVKNTKFGVGYQHNLSKRTYIYADVAHQSKGVATEKTGYDLGIRHSF